MGAGEHMYHCLYNLSGIAGHSLAALRAISCLARGVPFSCTQKFLHAHFVSTHKLGAKMSVSVFFFKPSCFEAIIKLPHSQWPRAPYPGEADGALVPHSLMLETRWGRDFSCP